MVYKRRITAQVHRLGRVADVLVHSRTRKNSFNNPESAWTKDREVLCFRTYPNRNTEVSSSTGDYHRDRPVFIFPKDDFDNADTNEPPGNNDRLRYPSGDGVLYEMQAPTHYDTHVEIFGEVVTTD